MREAGGKLAQRNVTLLGRDRASCEFGIELPPLIAVDVGRRRVLRCLAERGSRSPQRPDERRYGCRDERDGDEPEKSCGWHEKVENEVGAAANARRSPGSAVLVSVDGMRRLRPPRLIATAPACPVPRRPRRALSCASLSENASAGEPVMSEKEQNIREDSLAYHRRAPPGKIALLPTKQLTTQRDLALAYSPGVAAACDEIVRDPHQVSALTARGNLVGVVHNGTAVMGLRAI